jgi:hypothetical protein
MDHVGMYEEAKRLKNRFVTHRIGDYEHRGWKSLVLHGVSESHTDYWKAYGYESAVAAAEDSNWTKASEECPIIMDFIRNTFPSQRFARVRLMLLEANGYISPHTDSSVPILENINIALNNPEGCIWQWGDGETLFMEPGSCYAMNIHYPHSIINNSNEDRYHLIIHRHDSTDEWKSLIHKACIEQNVSGEYFEHEILI